MKFSPRPYQEQIINHVLSTPRSAVWAGMGMGKTAATLQALNLMNLIDEGKTLVIAPLRVARSTWPDEVAKWDDFSGLTVSVITGTPKERKAALKKAADIYTINYENLPWLIETLDGHWPFARVIADESTKLKNFRLRQGGKRARALASVAHRYVDRFHQLTGTPSPNGLVDLWGQSWFLDAGERLGRSFKGFADRWFVAEQVGSDAHAVRLRPRDYAREEIEQRMRDICISLDARDWFDMDEPIVNNIYVDLPRKARSYYEDMEKEMFLSIQGNDIEADNAAVRTMKCLQIANGAVYDEDGKWTEVHDLKLQALESIVDEAAGMPVLVAYHFKADLARLTKTFPQGRQLDQDPQTIRDWNAGKIPVMFAHPASAGHGLNLQDGGNILAFYGHWWNLEEYQQIIERIGPTRQAQAGHDRPVFIHHIIARDTVDELVMARRNSKRKVQDLLLEAMKRKSK